MSTEWADLTLAYLATRNPAYLNKAILNAQSEADSYIYELLHFFRTIEREGAIRRIHPAELVADQSGMAPDEVKMFDLIRWTPVKTIEQFLGPILSKLREASRIRDALVLSLLPVDLRAQASEAEAHSHVSPLDQETSVLLSGIQNARAACGIASEIGDKPCIAFYLSVEGSGLLRANMPLEAIKSFQKSLAIYKSLPADHLAVYQINVGAVALGLGAALLRETQYAQAQDPLEGAVAIYRGIAATDEIYNPSLAMALTYLGIVLGQRKDVQGARFCFKQADGVRLDDHQDLLRSMLYANWASLEAQFGDSELATSLIEKSIVASEGGISRGVLRSQRDRFKADIEPVYLELLDRTVSGLREKAPRWEIVGILEALRQMETLSDLAGSVPGNAWYSAFRQIIESKGDLSDIFSKRPAAFLGLHVTRTQVVFVTLRLGSLSVDIGSSDLVAAFRRLSQLIDTTFDGLSESIPEEQFIAEGRKAFKLLPRDVQGLLVGDGLTLLVSLCPLSINWPLELLVGPDSRYIGLSKQIARVSSLGALSDILRRMPPVGARRGAMIVGDPSHEGLPRLPGARNMANKLANELVHQGFSLLPYGTALIDNADVKPSEGKVKLSSLSEGMTEELAYWGTMGHGGLSGGQAVAYLALSGGDRLEPSQVAQQKLQGTFVHYDCCSVGTTQGFGGGRYVGHPIAALAAGASCILSSVHPLWDDTAAQFSEELYRRIFGGDEIGAALMATRNAIARQIPESPLSWASTVLWGNPWTKLTGIG
jgi:tetratricopeptide (TPR) repeat protein